MTAADQEPVTIDTVSSDAQHVFDLLDIIIEIKPDARAASLLWVARDCSERLAENLKKLVAERCAS